uniref:SPX domain-containing protein n=1 Tax=Salix viminalis TaxID=40686 RepID=A0A6N2LSH4_SALVM
MVKFSKQFEGQLVPEWKEAFVDYWQLKKDLKKIHLLNYDNSKNTLIKNNHHNSLSSDFLSSLKGGFSLFGHQHKDREAIHVHKKLASSASKGDVYETELFEQFEDSDAAREFFSCLDLQLNKVNQFYKNKEKEFLDRGDCLKKQMDILVELKSAFKQQRDKAANSAQDTEDASIDCRISCVAAEEDSVKDRIEQEQIQDDSTDDLEKDEVLDSSRSEEMGESRRIMKTEDSKLEDTLWPQGKNLRINIPLTTPSRTFSAISYLVWGDLVNQSSNNCNPEGSKLRVNKTKLHHAEKMIKGAFIELYKGLRYLETYRNLNMLAFIKILKKFDKVTEKQVLPIYLKVVESSYFNSSDKVMNLADEVEDLFIKHFVGEDRRKARKYLKPHQHKESHSVTFFIGLFTGSFIALLVGYLIMARITGMYRRHPDTAYMETVYPLPPSNELKYRDVFLICTSSMTVVVGIMFIHLLLLMKGHSYSQVQAIPGLLSLSFLLLLVCPFNFCYRSSRYSFLRVIKNIILSPLYKVVMLDFFMADQLCSQVPMLRNLEYVACYYLTGSYKTQDYGYCMRTEHYRDLAYAVSFLPYYWRAMQCARRWFDEGKTNHLINLGKYVSAMLAAGAKVAYEKEKSVGWLCLVVVISSSATIYQLYWDFVKDWGLLQQNSKNPWLRNELMLRRKFIYYFSMGLNLILRLAWLQTVIHSNFEHVDYRVTGLFLASLEVIRRGQWNFYRLENEHLNNAGKYRAVKTVPLPFHEVLQNTGLLRISQTKAALPKLSHWLFVVSGMEILGLAQNQDQEGAAIDIKLPRRIFLVQFTSNECRSLSSFRAVSSDTAVSVGGAGGLGGFGAGAGAAGGERTNAGGGAGGGIAGAGTGAGDGEAGAGAGVAGAGAGVAGAGVGTSLAGAGAGAGAGVAGAGAGASLAGAGAGTSLAGDGAGVSFAGAGDTCGGGKEGGGVAGGGGSAGVCTGAAAGGLCGGCGGGTLGLVAGATLGDGGDIGVVAGGGVTALIGDCVGVVEGGGVVAVGAGAVGEVVDGDASGVWASVIANGKLRQAKMRAQSTKAILL